MEQIKEEKPGRVRRTQEERTRQTRAKILQAAIDIIDESGLGAATTIDIAERAGVSRGALQHHFASKDDLMMEVVYLITEKIDRDEGLGRNAAVSLEEKIDQTVEDAWNIYGDPSFFSALEIELTARFDPSVRAKLAERFTDVGGRRDEEWAAFFAGTALSPADGILLRRLLLDTLRGMSLRKLISGEEQAQAQLRLLKRILRQVMTGGIGR